MGSSGSSLAIEDYFKILARSEKREYTCDVCNEIFIESVHSFPLLCRLSCRDCWEVKGDGIPF